MSADVVEGLVEAAGIERLVIVDDAYAATLPKFLEVLAGLSPDERASVTGLKGADVRDEAPWRERATEVWEKADNDARAAMIDNAYAFDAELSPLPEGTAERLHALLPGLDPEAFTLDGWRKGQAAVVEQMGITPTLVLFDQDFTLEEGGTSTTGQALVRDLETAMADANIGDEGYYGILTNTVVPEAEHDTRLKIVAETQVDPQRFVLISKQHLQGDSATFAMRLRTTLLAPVMSQLMHATSTAVKDAEAEALTRAHAIPPEDMEQMVIRGSEREGVWELDTLLRVFEILQRAKVRSELREKSRVIRLTERLRALADIDPLKGMTENERERAATVRAPAPHAIALQHDEIYESEEHVNRLHLPLELGDLFSKQGSQKLYVLLVQPCDVLVRTNGRRAPDLTHFLLAEVVRDAQKGLFEAFELPYFDESGQSRFVKLSRPAVTRVVVLDACVLNADGKARLDRHAESAESLLPHWRERHILLKRSAEQMLGHVEGRSDVATAHRKALAGFVAGDPFAPAVDLATGNIEWNCRRVGRVCDPYARALLSRFTQYLARDAYLLDLARI